MKIDSLVRAKICLMKKYDSFESDRQFDFLSLPMSQNNLRSDTTCVAEEVQYYVASSHMEQYCPSTPAYECCNTRSDFYTC